MQFRTIIPIEKSQNPIHYKSQLLLMGSCFAENMGMKFEYFKFKNSINPFGIIFNPVSIEKLLERVVSKKFFTAEDIFLYNDLWHCYEVHSGLSNPNKEAFLSQLNNLIEKTHSQIPTVTHCQITYGTSWIYRNIESNEIVANCHKVPQKQFTKELLSIEMIEKSVTNTVDLIQKINPNCRFIFTVSPVRHSKDGFVENTVSKAHLISALQQAINHKQRAINYFPSFEIMMDELRDYRFYAEDMLHPNRTAIDYIWERFSEGFIKETAFEIMQEVDSIQKSILHRPFNSSSPSHLKFLTQLTNKIQSLQNKCPSISF
ncbi:GSCFA domain-containing protein [Flavobacterium sp.]